MKQPIKMTPGDELHLTALMAPFSLNLVTGQDRQHLLGYGRSAFEAGLDEGRAQAAPAAVAVPDERSDFEAWATLSGYEGFERAMRGEGHYLSITLEELWQSWNESRAALAATTAADVPTGYVCADQAYSVLQLHEDLQDVWSEANAVDTVIGRPDALMKKLTRIRDAVANAANGYLPIAPAAAAQVVLPEPDAAVKEVMGLVQDYFVVGTDEARDAIESKLRALLAGVSAPAAQVVVAERAEGVHADPYPKKCPVTGRAYFMHLKHPKHGLIPTFGGPYDSYSMPYAEGEPTDPWHERELSVHRYDHDRGHWVEDESIPLRIIFDEALWKLQEASEAAPQTQADARDAGRYRWLRSRDLETISQGGVFAGMTPQNVILNEEDLDEAVDAAIAAQAAQQGGAA